VAAGRLPLIAGGSAGLVGIRWQPAGRSDSLLRSTTDVRSVVAERCSDLVEPLHAQSAPVRELVVSIPTPRRGYRQREDPTLAKQVWISRWIVLADLFGGMGDVELDRSAAACLQVDEQLPFPRPEHIAWMRLTMQQLLIGAAVADRAAQPRQRVAEQSARRLTELRGARAVANQPLRLCDPIGEVRRRNVDLAHAGMQPHERPRVRIGREVG